jgi:ATP-binding protein involved in chromosome partitioning
MQKYTSFIYNKVLPIAGGPMDNVKNQRDNVILIMSGKGGVGKTTVAVNLAYALSQEQNIGLLDIDLHGPNVPKMLGIDKKNVLADDNQKLIPINYSPSLKVLSIAPMIEHGAPVIWRGPMKHKVIKQFTQDVLWGDLDFLIIDFPPGTGDEYISTVQLIKNIFGAVIVSMPQEVSLIDSERSINFCKKMNIPIIGLIENMAGEIFGKGKVKEIADNNKVKFLGSISLNSTITDNSNKGVPFYSHESKAKEEFDEIIKKIKEVLP